MNSFVNNISPQPASIAFSGVTAYKSKAALEQKVDELKKQQAPYEVGPLKPLQSSQEDVYLFTQNADVEDYQHLQGLEKLYRAFDDGLKDAVNSPEYSKIEKYVKPLQQRVAGSHASLLKSLLAKVDEK